MVTDKLTLILGAPRSGTTWLAKIFDSHPSVLYRHEPDLVVKSDTIPEICLSGETDRYIEPMRCYFRALLDDRSLKSCGKLPIFRKEHESAFAYARRRVAVYGLHFARTALPVPLSQRMQVPMLAPEPSVPVYPVIKSISGFGRAGLILRALPECRIVFILREPFGQVASRLQGLARDKFERNRLRFQWVDTVQARRLGLTEPALRRMAPAEQLAWEWAMLNEIALDAIGQSERVRIVRYMDLVRDPSGCARDLFAFCGLSWREETERFIVRSSTFKGPDLYYQVYKNSAAIRDKWRVVLSSEEKRQILSVMQASPVGRLWPELLNDPGAIRSFRQQARPAGVTAGGMSDCVFKT